MSYSIDDPHPENKSPYAVYVNHAIISQGSDPVAVYTEAESKIVHTGDFIIYEGAFIHQSRNATPTEMKIALRGLSRGVALWEIDSAHREVKSRLSDMMVLGLTEAEAVIYIVKEYAEILPSDAQKCSEAILNSNFSPQYFSKTYARARSKMSEYNKVNTSDIADIDE